MLIYVQKSMHESIMGFNKKEEKLITIIDGLACNITVAQFGKSWLYPSQRFVAKIPKMLDK